MALSVLIFDSGVGGLTIYESVRTFLPDAVYTYLFDNRCFPYGELQDDYLIERVCSVIAAGIANAKPDLIIIACNSASTLALPELRKRFTTPVIGVVPAIKPAAQQTQNGIIGLLATPGTVMRSYTFTLIEDFAFDKLVLPIGNSELVRMAEEKMMGKAVDLMRLAEILSPWIGHDRVPDTVVLGCTHFPLIKEELQKILGLGVRFIDSGEAIGRRAQRLAQDIKSEGNALVQKSRVYCTRLDEKINALEDQFRGYGFENISELTIAF